MGIYVDGCRINDGNIGVLGIWTGLIWRFWGFVSFCISGVLDNN